MLFKAGQSGRDLLKKDKPMLPESLGVYVAGLYLIVLTLFIPINYLGKANHSTLVSYLSALLSICCMILLGFVDDVLDLRWRDKVFLPAVASLPLLLVYFVNEGITYVTVPIPFREYFGNYIDLAIFCTNSINILAGINGLEVGQSVVIAIFIMLHNIIQIMLNISPQLCENNYFSLYMLIPFTTLSLTLLKYNWYPAKVFVGDTYCYFAGMTFAVVGILGHFSKTMMLFFLPQIFNFVFSVPQLFKMVPCPRHRMPNLNVTSGKLENSFAEFDLSEVNIIGLICIKILRALGLIDLKKAANEERVIISNFTILNSCLIWFGSLSERDLAKLMIFLQIFACLFGLSVRYGFSNLLY
ncbi:Glycosyl transferase, family 4 domain-containing protein [Rozella allomycis CSF55]|uniref:UDP-N-acetylglucosamine--dolichyl-phosphate N-acetylglucosaminephosphotransferase n=1 Tax=Rozella allomycis (strain CSF55) TaxID=988480 RepID=A0A075B2W5_ROZAC|nr:Glycosyl transferase, family 4 domain-containing protein [Rozella allomycis CSF55]|eukprot:EPZ35316.1 Glycosyl transferase, family 4 domain-containing protein [Rozella allomycis CSF55]